MSWVIAGQGLPLTPQKLIRLPGEATGLNQEDNCAQNDQSQLRHVDLRGVGAEIGRVGMLREGCIVGNDNTVQFTNVIGGLP